MFRTSAPQLRSNAPVGSCTPRESAVGGYTSDDIPEIMIGVVLWGAGVAFLYFTFKSLSEAEGSAR